MSHRAPHTRLTLLRDSMVPVMVTRLILSLKEAAVSPGSIWTAGQLVTTVRFAERTVGGSGRRGDISLKDLSSGGSSGLESSFPRSSE